MMDAELQLLLSQALDPFSGPSDGASVGCSRFFCQEKTCRTMQAYTHNALLTSAFNLLYMWTREDMHYLSLQTTKRLRAIAMRAA